jgi:hypothetical protein
MNYLYINHDHTYNSMANKKSQRSAYNKENDANSKTAMPESAV